MRLIISITFALALCTVTGCSTSSRFHTKPDGAKLYVNGDYVGETPVVYTDRRSMPKRLHIQIRKEGYKELDFYIDKTTDYLGTFLSMFYGFGVPWSASLDNVYHINLGSLKLKSSEGKVE